MCSLLPTGVIIFMSFSVKVSDLMNNSLGSSANKKSHEFVKMKGFIHSVFYKLFYAKLYNGPGNCSLTITNEDTLTLTWKSL